RGASISHLCGRHRAPLEFLCIRRDLDDDQAWNRRSIMRRRPPHRACTAPAVRNRHAPAGRPNRIKQARLTPACATARAYDQAGEAYGAYADGREADEGGSTSRFAHADTIVWHSMRKTIDELRERGITRLRILDAGCGPGTWVGRVAAYAHRLNLGID